MSDQRSEHEVVEGLSPDARLLLKRVLEIERGRLHVKAAEATVIEEILHAIRGIKQ